MAKTHRSEVVVIGAGPVGMYAALGLHKAGVQPEIYDSGRTRAMHSYALVLHADTVRMLDEEGLAGTLATDGRAVSRLELFEAGKQRGELRLANEVVVLPQSTLESILVAALTRRGIKVHWDHRVQGIEAHDDRVRLTVAKLDKVSTGYPVAHTEAVVDKLFDVEARYVIAADGYDSFVRRRLGIADTQMGKGQLFSVFQFEADGDIATHGHLMLEPHRVGGYWPLPNGQARFSFPIDAESEHHADGSRLGGLIAERAPWFRGRVGAVAWTAVGLFERKLATSFGSGRVWLAGDAAHLTGPLGAQSMNVGLRESRDLAKAVAADDPSALQTYAARALEEWRGLLSPEPRAGDWKSLLRPCLPASGSTLDALLAQV